MKRTRRLVARLLHYLTTCCGLTLALSAQCQLDWQFEQAVAGANGPVSTSTMWDPDGPGPLPNLLVIGGRFDTVGDTAANNIAAWEPTSGWRALGAGTNQEVRALAVLPNGALAVGGSFWLAGGAPADRVAIYDGQTWQALGPGFQGGPVLDLAVRPTGELIAGGNFWFSGSTPVNHIAEWNGSAWVDYDAGLNGEVRTLTVMPNGDVIVGGAFSRNTAGTLAMPGIGRWDGTSWSTYLTPFGFPGEISASILRSNGRLTVAGGTAFEWTGTAWIPIGGSPSHPLQHLIETSDGTLYGCGGFGEWFWPAGASVLQGNQWVSFTEPTGVVHHDRTIHTLTELPNGEIAIGGKFAELDALAIRNLAIYDGSTVRHFEDGIDLKATAMAVMPDGDVIVAGQFTRIGGIDVNRIARFDRETGTFSPLGAGLNGLAYATLVLPDGDLVVAGGFNMAGGQPAPKVARWDGSNWHGYGSGPPNTIRGLALMPNGDLVVGGSGANHWVHRWDGTTWSMLGSVFDDDIHAMHTRPNGEVIVAGEFDTIGSPFFYGSIARWTAGNWQPLAAGISGDVRTLLDAPNGDLIVGGWFTQVSGQAISSVARWDGTAWHQVGASPPFGVAAMARLPNGDLLAATFNNSHIYRFDGTSWTTVVPFDGFGLAALAHNGHDVYAAGDFTANAQGRITAHFARLTTDCPAAVTQAGAGCSGGSATNELTATQPWIGSVVTETGSGLPSASFAVVVRSLTPGSVALASLLPQGQPGCSLWMAPSLLQLEPVVGGTATSSITLPNTAALIGTEYYSQMVLFAVDPHFNVLSLTSTNALQLTIGKL